VIEEIHVILPPTADEHGAAVPRRRLAQSIADMMNREAAS
jgi:hypothetical protein